MMTYFFLWLLVFLEFHLVGNIIKVQGGREGLGGALQWAGVAVALWQAYELRIAGSVDLAMMWCIAGGIGLGSIWWDRDVLRLLRCYEKESTDQSWAEMLPSIKSGVLRHLVFIIVFGLIYGVLKILDVL